MISGVLLPASARSEVDHRDVVRAAVRGEEIALAVAAARRARGRSCPGSSPRRDAAKAAAPARRRRSAAQTDVRTSAGRSARRMEPETSGRECRTSGPARARPAPRRLPVLRSTKVMRLPPSSVRWLSALPMMNMSCSSTSPTDPKWPLSMWRSRASAVLSLLALDHLPDVHHGDVAAPAVLQELGVVDRAVVVDDVRGLAVLADDDVGRSRRAACRRGDRARPSSG